MYDLVIIGGGPGGLSSAIYALRAKMNVLLLEKAGIGGQIALSDIIENYPGFRSLTGMELMSKMEDHAKDFGLKTQLTTVQDILSEGDEKVIKTDSEDIRCRSVIVASGAKPRKLEVPGEDEFEGRGVSYCATCDGPFYNQKDVVVVGGGDTAVKEALYLTKIAKKVHLVHRRDRLRSEKIMQEMILNNPKVQFHWESVAEEIIGDNTGVTGVRIKSLKDRSTRDISADGAFIFVGTLPNADFVGAKKDEAGFIIVNEKMESSIRGVYAIGDIRNTPLRQVVTAVGDGAIAAVMAEEYVSLLEGNSYPDRSC